MLDDKCLEEKRILEGNKAWASDTADEGARNRCFKGGIGEMAERQREPKTEVKIESCRKREERKVLHT